MENNRYNISDSLAKTLIESDLSGITTDVLESIIDKEFFEDGLIKDIPIINLMIGLGKTVNSVQNYLFTKKILSFLNGLSKISREKRKKVISRIESDSKYNQTVGSKLLFILDNAQDHTSAKLISKLFVAFIEEKMTYKEFCKSYMIINKIDYYDLEVFLQIPDKAYNWTGIIETRFQEVSVFLINAGLCSSEVTIEDQDDQKYRNNYFEQRAETIIHRTPIGTKIFEVLTSSNYSKK